MQFTDFARSHGVEIKNLLSGEKIRRCATTEHPKKRNGAYFWDGERGWVFNWETDAQTHWFSSDDKPWTESEKQEWKRRQQSNFEKQERDYAAAARKAQAILQQAETKQHDYLIRKGFPDAQGLVLPDGALVIPMRNVRTNTIQGFQRIQWVDMEWQKKMMPDMRAKYAVFRMGPKNASETVFCEGYATGLSIYQAARMFGLDMAVVVCFSANNMIAVADQIPGKKYVYADNDASGTGEAAAIKTGLPFCMSGTVGNDANDDHQQFGLMSVVQRLMDVRLLEVMRC